MKVRLIITVVGLFCILFSYPVISKAQGNSNLPEEILDAIADELGDDVRIGSLAIDSVDYISPSVGESSTGVSVESGTVSVTNSGVTTTSVSLSYDPSEDFDGDTMIDDKDNCPELYNKDQKDSDNDGIGDLCDETPEKDRDKDGIPDAIDNCLYSFNPDQADSNGDNQGDMCTKSIKDYDKDTVMDLLDNCPYTYNPDQIDINKNGTGDKCESDTDLKFKKDPDYKIKDDKIFITWQTNIASKGALRFGSKVNDLNGYISDTEEVKKHELSFNIQDSEEMFFSVVASAEDKTIESKLITINLSEDKDSTLEQEIVVTDEYMDSSSKYKDILFSKIVEESGKLRKNIVTTSYIVIVLILSVLMVTSWSHFMELFSKARDRIKYKK